LKKSSALFWITAFLAIVISSWLFSVREPALNLPEGNVERGAVVFAAADCTGCHTDSKANGSKLAGGAAITTQFGTFYAPNITPDQTEGVGSWTAEDFHRAMREGTGKDGEYLYPAFPYTSFTGMSDQDIADIWAFLKTVPPSPEPSQPQEAAFPFNVRTLLMAWRMLYFDKGPLQPVTNMSAEWNRGRYLVEAVAHCQECHSPRNALGGIDWQNAYSGNPNGPDDMRAPNITPDPTGIADWSENDLDDMLTSGVTPWGDYLAGGMLLVVEGTSKLNASDRQAMIVYLRSIPPRPSTAKEEHSNGSSNSQ
jgi:mono/diheme cytochrome c family protein